MKPFDVQIALEAIGEARTKWAEANARFNADVEAIMTRLLNEAAANHMSAEQVAKFSGFTVKRVRLIMRVLGLNPKDGKRLLARKAAENLHANAALLGIEPHEFDLMSPLAYLPMGEEMKRFLETERADTVLIRIDRETWEEHEANGECPVSSACCGCHLDFATLATQTQGATA